jgi:hypothetical protein
MNPNTFLYPRNVPVGICADFHYTILLFVLLTPLNELAEEFRKGTPSLTSKTPIIHTRVCRCIQLSSPATELGSEWEALSRKKDGRFLLHATSYCVVT